MMDKQTEEKEELKQEFKNPNWFKVDFNRFDYILDDSIIPLCEDTVFWYNHHKNKKRSVVPTLSTIKIAKERLLIHYENRVLFVVVASNNPDVNVLQF